MILKNIYQRRIFLKTFLTACFCPFFLYQQPVALDWTNHFSEGTSSTIRIYQTKATGDRSVIHAGWFTNTIDFDPGPATYTLAGNIYNSDFFFSKLDALGNFVWAKKIESVGPSVAIAPVSFFYPAYLHVDNSDNILIFGFFQSEYDFDPSSSSFTMNPVNGSAFVAKYDHNGILLWAKQFGGISATAYGLETDSVGKIYITGAFRGLSADFDPGPGVVNCIGNASVSSIFYMQLDQNGSLQWAHSVTGKNSDAVSIRIKVNPKGEMITIGHLGFDTLDFDPGIGTYLLHGGMTGSMFATKHDPLGNLLWAKGIQDISINLIALDVDEQNNVSLGGSFAGTVDFDPGPGVILRSAQKNSDAFILRLDPTGNFIGFSQLGSGDNEQILTLSHDCYGNIYSAGTFGGTTDFDPGPGIFNLSSSSPTTTNLFIHKMSGSGNFNWAFTAYSTNLNFVFSLDLDIHGDLIASGGSYAAYDIDPGTGATTFGKGGFVARFVDSASVRHRPIDVSLFNERTTCAPGQITLRALGGESWYTSLNNVTSVASGTSINFPAPTVGIYTLFVQGDASCYSVRSSITYSVEDCTNIQTTNDYLTGAFFPNPTAGKIRCLIPDSFRGGTLIIYDSEGLIQQSLPIQEQEYELDISYLTNGMYLIKLCDHYGRVFSRKLIKQ